MKQSTSLQEMSPVRMRWEPVDKILALNGIPLLLRVIAYSYEWNYSGRYENKFLKCFLPVCFCQCFHFYPFAK